MPRWKTDMLVTVGLRGSLSHLVALPHDTIVDYLQRIQILLSHARVTSIIKCTPDNSPSRMITDLDNIGSAFTEKSRGLITAVTGTQKAIDRSKKRFVIENAAPAESTCGCLITHCRFIVDISGNEPQETCKICGTKYISISSWYFNSDFYAITRYSQEFVTNQWDKRRFHADIWEPIFRYARLVEIYDPHVTWALADTSSSDQENEDLSLSEQYIRGVQWICESFGEIRRKYPTIPSRTITFFGELSYYHAKRHANINYRCNDAIILERVGEIFRSRCNLESIESIYGIEVRLQINLYAKDDPPNARMRHNRYVRTDQAVLAIDRGVAAMPQVGRLGFTDVILLSPTVGDVIASGIPFQPTSDRDAA